MESFKYYVLLFFIYSFIGWIIEIINFVIEKHKIVDRGFLIGPCLPIYGFGSLFIIILCKRYYSDPIALFCMCTILCSVLEYTTSVLMEKMFKARWWDYRDKKFNLNGRICLETAIPFGIGGCIIIYVANPIFDKFIASLNGTLSLILVSILLTIFVIDFLVSFKVVFNFRKYIKDSKKDSTWIINKKVKDVLFNNSFLNNRLLKAFPNVQSTVNGLRKKKFYFFKRK